MTTEVERQKRTIEERRISHDRELFSRFLEGDDGAFMEFFDLHTDRLGRYCRKMVGDHQGGDDVLQDMWEKVIRMRTDEKPLPPNPLGLLYWIARNLCLNRIRDRKPHPSIDALPESIHPRAEDHEPSRLEELVVIALERLPLSQREPLILNAYSGYTFEEVAQMMDESVGAIRTRAWRGRRQLKRLITALIDLDENNEQDEE